MKKYDSFCVDAQKSGVKEEAGKKAYPLHKIISEARGSGVKFGNNGLPTGKKK